MEKIRIYYVSYLTNWTQADVQLESNTAERVRGESLGYRSRRGHVKRVHISTNTDWIVNIPHFAISCWYWSCFEHQRINVLPFHCSWLAYFLRHIPLVCKLTIYWYTIKTLHDSKLLNKTLTNFFNSPHDRNAQTKSSIRGMNSVTTALGGQSLYEIGREPLPLLYVMTHSLIQQ